MPETPPALGRFERLPDGRPFLPSCLNCRHLRDGGPACDAFPEGIPAPILAGEVDHRLPAAGDNGVRWEVDHEAVALTHPPPRPRGTELTDEQRTDGRRVLRNVLRKATPRPPADPLSGRIITGAEVPRSSSSPS